VILARLGLVAPEKEEAFETCYLSLCLMLVPTVLSRPESDPGNSKQKFGRKYCIIYILNINSQVLTQLISVQNEAFTSHRIPKPLC
jgi:hypothetical protein